MNIELRPAMPTDEDFLLDLRNSPVIVAAGRSRQYVGLEWLKGAIDVIWAPVGYVRLDPAPDDTVEVSIALTTRARGQGIGPEALRLLRKRYGKLLVAHIKPDNAASIAAFTKAGYQDDGRTDQGLLRFITQ